MEWIVLIVALVISLGALAYVMWPLLRQGHTQVLVEDDRLADLLGRKDSVMSAIKDLEFDYHVGKMDEEDYRRYDARLRRQAIGLMQQIEQIAPESAHLDAGLEAEIAHRRKVRESAPVSGVALSDSLEQEISARRKVQVKPAAAAPVAGVVAPGNGRSSVAATESKAESKAESKPEPQVEAGATRRFCTNCGHTLEPQHKFCANCGAPAVSAAAPSLAAGTGGA